MLLFRRWRHCWSARLVLRLAHGRRPCSRSVALAVVTTATPLTTTSRAQAASDVVKTPSALDWMKALDPQVGWYLYGRAILDILMSLTC
jgi:hypothetical protein